MKELMENSDELFGGYPWMVSLKVVGKSIIPIKETVTIKEIEFQYRPQDGDMIFELRPLTEFIYTREDGLWYRKKVGNGYA